MKTCVIIYTDINYVEHTKYILGAIRKYGKWDGDIILIQNGFSSPDGFWGKKTIIYSVPQQAIYWAKINIFKKEFTGIYDRVLYLDQDCIIYLPIQPLFEQPGDFLSDDDTKLVRQDFKEIDDGIVMPEFEELKTHINVNAVAFCSGIMRFNPKILPNNFNALLFEMREKYKNINYHNGITEGMSDQAILNIWFCEQWKQFDRACYIGRRKENTILAHCTSWHAPWVENRKVYDECVKYFEEVL
jgi:alpha-N-acetylglucosamine transferase